MTNAERIGAHNAKLQECLTLAEGLPDAGGGKCDKPHVIEVEVLPDVDAVDVNAVYLCGGRYYKYTSATLESVYLNFGEWYEYKEVLIAFEIPEENISYNIIPTKTTEGILATEANIACHLYYIEDENNLFVFQNGEWVSFDEFIGEPPITNGGVISDISEAVDEDKYYVVLSGGWKEWIPKEECGGGAELNIAYGDTPPEDTTKLWCKCDEPSGVIVSTTLTPHEDNREASIDWMKGNIPEAIYRVGASCVGSQIYIFGGYNLSKGLRNTIYCLDTISGLVRTVGTTLPQSCAGIACASVGTNIYLFRGRDNEYSTSNSSTVITDVWIFDATKETIRTRTGSEVDAYDRFTGCGCVSVGEKIYLFGGYAPASKSYLEHCQIFNAAIEKFEYCDTKLPTTLCDAYCVAIGKKIYIASGITSSTGINNSIFCFDTTDNSVSTLPTSLPVAGSYKYRILGTAGGKLYFFSGFSGNSPEYPQMDIYCYDLGTNNLELLPFTMKAGVSYGCAVTVNDDIYIIGNRAGNSSFSRPQVFFAPTQATALDNEKLQIVPTNDVNVFPIVNTEAVHIEIGVGKIFKGNAENKAEQVEALLYQNDAWTSI